MVKGRFEIVAKAYQLLFIERTLGLLQFLDFYGVLYYQVRIASLQLLKNRIKFLSFQHEYFLVRDLHFSKHKIRDFGIIEDGQYLNLFKLVKLLFDEVKTAQTCLGVYLFN